MRLIKTLLAGLALTLLSLGWAQIERQHEAHIHGQGQGTLAVDGQTWVLSLALPGFNVVGFEHAPRTTEEMGAIETAKTLLQAGDWLRMDPRGRCAPPDVQVSWLGGEADEAHDHGHHDDKHHHAHDGGDEGGHARFELMAQIICENSEAMRWVEWSLFSPFPNNERITVDVLTAQSAFQAQLSADSPTIRLKP